MRSVRRPGTAPTGAISGNSAMSPRLVFYFTLVLASVHMGGAKRFKSVFLPRIRRRSHRRKRDSAYFWENPTGIRIGKGLHTFGRTSRSVAAATYSIGQVSSGHVDRSRINWPFDCVRPGRDLGWAKIKSQTKAPDQSCPRIFVSRNTTLCLRRCPASNPP